MCFCFTIAFYPLVCAAYQSNMYCLFTHVMHDFYTFANLTLSSGDIFCTCAMLALHRYMLYK